MESNSKTETFLRYDDWDRQAGLLPYVVRHEKRIDNRETAYGFMPIDDFTENIAYFILRRIVIDGVSHIELTRKITETDSDGVTSTKVFGELFAAPTCYQWRDHSPFIDKLVKAFFDYASESNCIYIEVRGKKPHPHDFKVILQE